MKKKITMFITIVITVVIMSILGIYVKKFELIQGQFWHFWKVEKICEQKGALFVDEFNEKYYMYDFSSKVGFCLIYHKEDSIHISMEYKQSLYDGEVKQITEFWIKRYTYGAALATLYSSSNGRFDGLMVKGPTKTVCTGEIKSILSRIN